MSSFLFTSESVSEGHPDKVADQISDAVLDAILAQDKRSRVAAETLVKDNLVVLAGEITTGARVNYDHVARQLNQWGFAVRGYDQCGHGESAGARGRNGFVCIRDSAATGTIRVDG